MSGEVGVGPRYSLRRRVVWWLLPPLAVMLAVNAWLSYRGALEAVNRAYDRSLTASIKAVAEQTHSVGGEVHVNIPYSAFEMFEDKAQERIYYAVIAPSGALLTGYPELVPPSGLPESGEVLIVDSHFRGEDIRLGAMSKRLYDPVLVGGDAVRIVFAETTGSRVALARNLFLDSLRRQILLLCVGAVLIVFALRSAFRPLVELSDSIRRRREEDLTPVPAANVPREVGPLIDAINHHTERLSAMLVARRRFLADAAHQIRTPLAVLTTQAEYGLRQHEPEEMLRTFASLLRSIRATRRLANQMLTMSRAEAVNGLMDERAPVDLNVMIKEVAIELVPLALKKGIDLAFEGPQTEVIMLGNPPMLREMVANLIDNAIRYSPPESQITVAVAAWHGDGMISVTDQGPGIPEAEREKVFRRFYRILGHGQGPGHGDTDGSGLGLAIVREICVAHGGTITLKDGEGGRGLCVEVELPLSGRV